MPPKATVITEDELAEMKRRAIITSLADEVAAREAKEKILEVGLVPEGFGVRVATGMYLLVVVYHLAISLDTINATLYVISSCNRNCFTIMTKQVHVCGSPGLSCPSLSKLINPH